MVAGQVGRSRSRPSSTTRANEERVNHERTLMSQPVAGLEQDAIIDDIFLGPRCFMTARRLEPGEACRIIDLEGQQVADFILFDPSNLKNHSSASNSTLVAKRRHLTTGDGIYSKLGDTMATITGDTIGVMASGGFCSPAVNQLRYSVEGTPSCAINLCASMSAYGLSPLDIDEGANFSPGTYIVATNDSDGELLPTPSRPGDYFEFRAEMPIIVALSNCPAERSPCNAWHPTSLRIVIHRVTTTLEPAHRAGRRATTSRHSCGGAFATVGTRSVPRCSWPTRPLGCRAPVRISSCGTTRTATYTCKKIVARTAVRPCRSATTSVTGSAASTTACRSAPTAPSCRCRGRRAAHWKGATCCGRFPPSNPRTRCSHGSATSCIPSPRRSVPRSS